VTLPLASREVFVEPEEAIEQAKTTEDGQSEAQLSLEISTLWSAHGKGKATARRTREELTELRQQLGERLHALKSTLARTGRGGRWISFLRSCGIPRSSADRMITRHVAMLNPPQNCPIGAISTPDQARAFVQRMLPKLRRLLTSIDTVDAFYDALITGIPATGFRG
jgi:hypothetical protein